MSVGALGRSIAAPAADASRVAAIRNKLDLKNAGELASFGEPARKGVLAGVERFLVEVRSDPLGDAVQRLRAVQARLEALDPNELEPRGGLDNLFNGRTARLHRFRRAFEAAATELDRTAGEMEARMQKIGRQSDALNGLHEQARALILDLDAYLDAGRARLAEARGAADQTAAERLGARLEDLERTRLAALQQLPLSRVIQNTDHFLSEALAGVRPAATAWRGSWSELLGIGRNDKVRPHLPALAENKLKAVQALARIAAILADHVARRADAESRMKAAAAGALKA